MKYVSTRGKAEAVSFSEAIERGLAPDGGLYVPEPMPPLKVDAFQGLSTVSEFSERLLRPFVRQQESSGERVEDDLASICSEAFSFPIPLRFLRSSTAVLELFHGPTAAFKDVGARFLAACMARRPSPADRRRTVLVATSGDTGGAVAGAFFNKPGIDVFVLYPKGKISSRQERQIVCWGGNVHAFAVRGSFDDCQRVVKEALRDDAWKKQRQLISANSINVGRLLPQMTYYAQASLEYERRKGVAPGFIVPTGNLGNAVAALWAKRIGFPIRQVVLATNANLSIANFFSTGRWAPSPTVATLANAMDVGNPSNMERLRFLYSDFAELKRDVDAVSVSDDEIRDTIRRGPENWGQNWCPHTATAVFAREKLPASEDWILVATAHPAKFETIVEPLIGKTLQVPASLLDLLNREPVSREIGPTLQEFKTAAAFCE